jgi:hypothetical protein
MAKSFAAEGLDFLAAAVEDERLTASELLEVVHFAVSLYREGTTRDAKAVHAAGMLCDALVDSRGSGRIRSVDRFKSNDESTRLERARTGAVTVTAAEILKADAKRRGEVVTLPPMGSTARMIVDADRRRRGEKVD